MMTILLCTPPFASTLHQDLGYGTFQNAALGSEFVSILSVHREIRTLHEEE
jgi:hypothetical protein